MTDTNTKLVWEYDGDGGLTATGNVGLESSVVSLASDILRVWNPEDERLHQLLDEWWSIPFRLVATARQDEHGEYKLNITVEDHEDLKGPLAVLLYTMIVAEEDDINE